MPYARRGNTIIKADSGKVVGHSKNPKKYLNVLRAVEHGWKPTGKKKKRKMKGPKALHKLMGDE